MLSIVTFAMCVNVSARHSEKAIRQAINNLDKYICTSLDGPDCATSIEPESLIDPKLQQLFQEKILEWLAEFGVESINDPADGTNKLPGSSAIDVSYESIIELSRADMDILKRKLMRGEIEIDLEEYEADLDDEEAELSEDELIDLFNRHVAGEQAIKKSEAESNQDTIVESSANEPTIDPTTDQPTPLSDEQSIDNNHNEKETIEKEGDDEVIEIDWFIYLR